MNWDRVQGDWKQFTGKVKQQWGQLTDNDLTQIDGSREQLEGKISSPLRIRQRQGEEGSRRLAEPVVVLRQPMARPQNWAALSF